MKERNTDTLEARLAALREQLAAWGNKNEGSWQVARDALARSEAEVERLREALAQISLTEPESTTSAAEKARDMARIARAALSTKQESGK